MRVSFRRIFVPSHTPLSAVRCVRSQRCLSWAVQPDGRSFSELKFSKSVRHALDSGSPVVCLESTIITHGMSFPSNLEMAQAVERTIYENGATPATIAVLDGEIKIGLETEDLVLLAKTGQSARKISRRDLASAIADGATGGTTVSGTMILAKMAGIRVFVTGGIGGVHRNAESTMDVSNDLNEVESLETYRVRLANCLAFAE